MATVPDIEAIRDVLEFHMKRTGMTGRQLSEAAGLNPTAVRDLLNKVGDPRFSTLLSLADALRASPATLFGGTVDIAGNINEHGEILPIQHNGSPPETVARPADLVGDALAYCVETEQLWPAYWPGDIVFASRQHDTPASEFLGRECIVQLAATGAILLRTIHEGSSPGRFTLSFHNIEKDLINVTVAWAAPVSDVKRNRPTLTVV